MKTSNFVDRSAGRASLAAASRSTAVLLIGLIVGSAWTTPAQATAVSEYEVKAASLIWFAKFVEWPDTAYADANAPFVIGILGDDPFGAVWDKLLVGVNVRNRKVVVKRAKKLDDLKGCQILFINKTENAPAVAAALGKENVLTVGDSDGFAATGGGVMNFFINEEGKVRFALNRENARRSGLKLNPQLLRLAKLVD